MGTQTWSFGQLNAARTQVSAKGPNTEPQQEHFFVTRPVTGRLVSIKCRDQEDMVQKVNEYLEKGC